MLFELLAMRVDLTYVLCLLIVPLRIYEVSGIRCYQCASSQEPAGQDSCGAYEKFEKEKHVAIDCNSDEANTPGTFCMKMVQQGPLSFIWDRRWRQVIRRCASVAEMGNTEVCNWGVYKNGVYWEECYCSQDGCNSSNTFKPNTVVFIMQMLASIFVVGYVMS